MTYTTEQLIITAVELTTDIEPSEWFSLQSMVNHAMKKLANRKDLSLTEQEAKVVLDFIYGILQEKLDALNR